LPHGDRPDAGGTFDAHALCKPAILLTLLITDPAEVLLILLAYYFSP
jgi:hypothetical protein